MTIGKKLMLGFGILVILIGLIGGYGILELGSVNSELNDLYLLHLKGVEYIKDADIQLIAIARARSNMILAVDAEEQQRHIANIRQRFEKFESNIQMFDQVTVTDVGKQKNVEILKMWSQVKNIENEIIAFVEKNDVTSAINLTRQSRQLADQIEAEIYSLVEIKNRLALESYNNSDTAYARTSVIMMSGTFLSFILGVIITVFMKKTISNPISKLEKNAALIAMGDLTVEAIQIKNTDEIGALANSFNKMTEGLRLLITNIITNAQIIASSSEELTAMSEQSALASEELSKTITDIANGASSQASDTSVAADNVVNIGNLLIQNSDFINEVTESAREIGDRKDEGYAILKQLIVNTNENDQAAQVVYDNIMSNNESAEKIERASSMIQSIADQTNLLALNAAIEAARAGEAGKGFAVVADEIRKLAEQSNRFTKEIKDIIDELKDRSQSAVETTMKVKDIVKEQSNSVSLTEQKFDMIAVAIEQTQSISQKLVHSSEMLSMNKEKIYNLMENLSAIAEENAAGSQQASASIEEQTATVEEIAKSSESLSLVAMELMELVKQFKI